MIYDTSVKSQKIESEIINLVGKSLPLWQRLKSGGTGCRRMTIQSCSQDIQKLLEGHPGTNYSSIEIRPKGIIVYLKNNLNTYSWPIPFYRLSIYKSEAFSIHGEGSFVKYEMDSNYEANQKFITKISQSRLKTLEN